MGGTIPAAADKLLVELLGYRGSWGCPLGTITQLLGRSEASARALLRSLEEQDILVGDTGQGSGSAEMYYLLTEEGETLAARAVERLVNPRRRGPPRGPPRGSIEWVRTHSPMQALMREILACPDGELLLHSEIRTPAGVGSVSMMTELLGYLTRLGWIIRELRLRPGSSPRRFVGYVAPTPAGRIAMQDLLRETSPTRAGAMYNVKMADSDCAAL